MKIPEPEIINIFLNIFVKLVKEPYRRLKLYIKYPANRIFPVPGIRVVYKLSSVIFTVDYHIRLGKLVLKRLIYKQYLLHKRIKFLLGNIILAYLRKYRGYIIPKYSVWRHDHHIVSLNDLSVGVHKPCQSVHGNYCLTASCLAIHYKIIGTVISYYTVLFLLYGGNHRPHPCTTVLSQRMDQEIVRYIVVRISHAL